jgi:hypothetical protein
MADIEQIIAQCSAIFPVSLASTYGALYIGFVFSVFCLGITNLQVYMYFQRYGDDKLWHKLTILFLWIQDLLHTALIAHSLYWYLISNYFKPWELLDTIWSFSLQLDLHAFTVLTVQLLYYVRLWKLVFLPNIKKSVWVRVWCALVTLILVSGTAFCCVLVWAVYKPTS